MMKTIFFILIILCPLAAHAVEPDEMLSDITLEARARVISQQLRCLVCQNESIDDSDAPLAHDLRVVLRQRLMVGDTDKQVRQYIVARYGDYVLLKPPLKQSTLALWLGPLLLLIGGMGGTALFFRQRIASELPLTAAEHLHFTEVMEENDGDSKSAKETDR